MTALRKPAGISPSQIRRIHALALGKAYLAWSPEDYRLWLMDAFNVSSSKDLSSAEASEVLTALGQLSNLARRDRANTLIRTAAERMAAWNAELFTPHALRGFSPVAGEAPPARRAMRHVAGMLWEVSEDTKNPPAYARQIIADALKGAGFTGDRIANEFHLAAVKAALYKRARRQGKPVREDIR